MNATSSILVCNEADVRIIYQIFCVIFWKRSAPGNILLYLFCSLEKLGLFHLKNSVIFLEIGSAMSSTQLACAHALLWSACEYAATYQRMWSECLFPACCSNLGTDCSLGHWCFMYVSPNDPMRSPLKIMSFMKSLACGQRSGLLAFVEEKR